MIDTARAPIDKWDHTRAGDELSRMMRMFGGSRSISLRTRSRNWRLIFRGMNTEWLGDIPTIDRDAGF